MVITYHCESGRFLCSVFEEKSSNEIFLFLFLASASSGVLVVNVTWRGKTYVGTLLDCTKNNWAPPRYVKHDKVLIISFLLYDPLFGFIDKLIFPELGLRVD